MEYLSKKNILIALVVVLIAIVYYRSSVVENFAPDGSDVKELENIDDFKVDLMKCSPQCCSDQWPTGITQKDGSADGLVANSFRCSNGVTSGCPCMKKDQFAFLSHRGGNIPLAYEGDELPAGYIIQPENKKLMDKETGTAVAYSSYDGQLYGLPNQGAIFDASMHLK